VSILDTTSGEVLSTIQIDRNTEFLACNSKFQILTCSGFDYLRLSDRKTTLWEKQLLLITFGSFSPAETFVIVLSCGIFKSTIVVLDAFSGKTLHVLGDISSLLEFDFGFVSDEECVFTYMDELKRRFVQLFNVKSGVLLSDLQQSSLFATSLCKSLLAGYRRDSEHGYQLIQVRLPEDEESRRSKW